MTDPIDRRELAAALRDLRVDAGLSTTELARQLGWSQSRVSRIERSVTLPKPNQVDAWTRHLRAEPDHRRALMASSDALSIQLTEWKRELAPGRRRVQQELSELEQAASVIYEFSADVVPGLLQTAPYAKAMFTMGRGHTADDVDGVVAARMDRKVTLADTRCELLMSETAVRRCLLSADAMRDQVDQLADIADTGSDVRLGMIPFTGRELVQQYHAFTVIGDPDVDDGAAVLVETVTRGLTIRTSTEVSDYVRYFRELTGAAIYGAELATFLREVSREGPWP